MSTPTYEEEIKPVADDLLVFIDDTGHETFAGNQGFYGLGGCLMTGFAYAHLKPQWRGVRKIIYGDPEAPLHGSDITANPKPESFAALRTFFEDRSFARIAVTTTKEVGLPVEMHPCVPVIGQLWKEVETVASVLPCNRLWIILESSDRADPVIMRSFGQLTSLNVPQAIHVEHCFMPKSANEPGLEVADFVVSAAGSEIQRRLRLELARVLWWTIGFAGFACNRPDREAQAEAASPGSSLPPRVHDAMRGALANPGEGVVGRVRNRGAYGRAGRQRYADGRVSVEGLRLGQVA